MTLSNVIPALWAGSILQNMNNAHVYAALFNRDYEGDIQNQGDSVKINSVGRVTIRTYTKNATLTAPETLQDNGQFLVVDQAQYYNFAIDDVDKTQQKPQLMSAFTSDAAWGLADVIDLYLGALLRDNTSSTNHLDSGTVRTLGVGAADADLYETLVDLGVALSDDNVPKTGRWVVISPWMTGLLQKDPRFTSFGTAENRGVLENGLVGRAAGFEIHESNNVPNASSTYRILAGVSSAATFAKQLTETELFRPPDRFADAMKGLCVYGAKITRPYAIAMASVQQAS